jgi:hypothetical protein
MKKLKTRKLQKKTKSHSSTPHVQTKTKRENRKLKPKISKYSFRIKRFFVQPFVSLIKHYEIREDLLKIYKAHVKEMYQNPKLRKNVSLGKKKWEERITAFRQESLKVDPRAFVMHYLNYVVDGTIFIKELLSRFLEWLFVIFIIILIVLGFNLIPVFESIQNTIDYWVILPIIVIIGFVWCYRKILITDTELFHMVNARLSFNPLDVYRSKRQHRNSKNNLIAMAIWNKSLSNYSNFAIIFSMLCIKIVSKRLIYRYLYRGLTEITPKHLEEYYNNPNDIKSLKKSIMSDWHSKFKFWWKDDHTLKNEDSNMDVPPGS